MALRRNLLRPKQDSNGIWGDIALVDVVDTDRFLRRNISRRVFAAVVVLIAAVLASFWFWVHNIDAAQANVPLVVAQARNSVVDVSCGNSAGTGVAISMPVPDGYSAGIFSAAHVFEDCKAGEKVTVTYHGRDYKGTLAEKDPAGRVKDFSATNDLALIYVKFHIPSLETAPAARVGDWAIAIGDPYDHINYVTFGIITEVNDDEYGTDASLNHGNSGGPLLDSHGRVLGIVSYGETYVDQHESNPKGIWDDAPGISYVKRMKLACEQILDNASNCPFSN